MADMTTHIRYFAAAAEAAGRDEEHLEIESGATLATLKELLIERYGSLMQRVVESGSFLIDGVVRRDPAHAVGASVDVLPPFAGG
ncbi:MoaD/ThiS family protein [Salinibacterium sp. NK8237]|nr:MoaD/ThiS family protein [Salinibacterium sp. NK8237]MBH0130006.1 MoaD/ThiS family protein [Salinibacterium sp. NK8237]